MMIALRYTKDANYNCFIDIYLNSDLYTTVSVTQTLPIAPYTWPVNSNAYNLHYLWDGDTLSQTQYHGVLYSMSWYQKVNSDV